MNKEELLKNLPIREAKERAILLDIAEKTLEAINPYALVLNELKKLDSSKYEHIFIIGTGKGASKMAEAAEKNFGKKITEGFITIPQNEPSPNLKRIKYINASHPLPNQNGVRGAKEILRIARLADKNDLVITLISGGGSALMPLPIKGITLKQKIAITSLLLKSGANINEINTVRKHMSQIKGGNLASAIYPATCLNLVISDVLGDDLSAIASGPVSPDPTTIEDALKIFKKYKITPPKHLQETTKTVKNVKSKILANHETAALTAKRIASKHNPKILDSHLEGDCNRKASEIMKKIKKGLYILTGETTVKITGKGKGGRNQQFVLACLRNAPKNTTILSIGTDGVDGICPENIAGAIASTSTPRTNIETYLKNNDSYHFFKKNGGLIKTGPTGTNLGDLILIKT